MPHCSAVFVLMSRGWRKAPPSMLANILIALFVARCKLVCPLRGSEPLAAALSGGVAVHAGEVCHSIRSRYNTTYRLCHARRPCDSGAPALAMSFGESTDGQAHVLVNPTSPLREVAFKLGNMLQEPHRTTRHRCVRSTSSKKSFCHP